MTKFLIIRTSSFGDILHGIPVAVALKERDPCCRIGWIVEERYQDLLSGHSCIDQLIRVRFKDRKHFLPGAESLRYWVTAARVLRRMSFDVAIDLQGLIRSGYISLVSGAPVRIGFPGGFVRERLNVVFSNVRPTTVPYRSHIVDRNLGLLHPLGIRSQSRSCRLRASSDQEASGGLLPRDDSMAVPLRIAVNPAAGWPTKQWPVNRFAQLADRIIKDLGAEIYLLWGPGEKLLAEEIRSLMAEPAIVVSEMGVKALMAFLSNCDIILSGDSGPMHLASALEKPVVALFGPSDPVRNGPFLGNSRVVRASTGCSPCYKRRCSDSTCMETITVEQVWGAVVELVGEMKAGSRLTVLPDKE